MHHRCEAYSQLCHGCEAYSQLCYKCEAHSHLSYQCKAHSQLCHGHEAHSQLHYRCEAHSRLSYQCETHSQSNVVTPKPSGRMGVSLHSIVTKQHSKGWFRVRAHYKKPTAFVLILALSVMTPHKLVLWATKALVVASKWGYSDFMFMNTLGNSAKTNSLLKACSCRRCLGKSTYARNWTYWRSRTFAWRGRIFENLQYMYVYILTVNTFCFNY